MSYTIKARYYSGPDNTGETYIITSNNADKDTRHEVGSKLMIIPMDVVEEAKSEAVKEVKEEVNELFKSNESSEPVEQERETKPALHISVTSMSYVVPDSCNECPISRMCPGVIVYGDKACIADIRQYYISKENKKTKP